jgi:purine-cytosine permease-like protein
MSPPSHDRPTPAWVIIGLLTSFLILILQSTLYTSTDPYASFIVSLTYTACIMCTCFVTLLGHLLVRRYPAIARFLNVDIDLASVMTIGGGRSGREMQEVGNGRRRESIGAWAEETQAPPPPPYTPPRAVMREDLQGHYVPTPASC